MASTFRRPSSRSVDVPRSTSSTASVSACRAETLSNSSALATVSRTSSTEIRSRSARLEPRGGPQAEVVFGGQRADGSGLDTQLVVGLDEPAVDQCLEGRPDAFAEAVEAVVGRFGLGPLVVEGGFEPAYHVVEIPDRPHSDLGVEVRIEVFSEARLDLLALPEQPPIFVGVGVVTDDPAVAHVIVPRPSGPAEHLEDVEGTDVDFAFEGIVIFGVPNNDTAGGEID